MDRNEQQDRIAGLIKLDVDAVEGYKQAIQKIDDPAVARTLTGFMHEHEDHIRDLSSYLIEEGLEPPERKPDLKGYLMEGFTILRSSTGTEGALKAVKSAEKMTNKKYGDAVNWDVPVRAREILRKNYADEQKHLAYVQEQLTIKSH